MFRSDIRILDECKDAVNELVSERKWQYVIYQLTTDDYTFSVEEKWGKDKTHDDLVRKLKEVEKQRQCRFVVLDVTIKKEDHVRDVPVLLSWIPDKSAIHQKMAYASCESLVRSTFSQYMCQPVSCAKDSDLALSNIQAQVH